MSLLRKLVGAALLFGAGAAVAAYLLHQRQTGRGRSLPKTLAPDDAVDDASDASSPSPDPPSRTAPPGTGAAPPTPHAQSPRSPALNAAASAPTSPPASATAGSSAPRTSSRPAARRMRAAGSVKTPQGQGGSRGRPLRWQVAFSFADRPCIV